MNYLLDTHVILWWLTSPEKIKTKIYKMISDRSNGIFLSSASFWEMAIKKSIGKLTLPHNLLETLTSAGFKYLSISPEECMGIIDLPMIHADPFDRLLIIQAKLHNLVIVTHDAQITKYPVASLLV